MRSASISSSVLLAFVGGGALGACGADGQLPTDASLASDAGSDAGSGAGGSTSSPQTRDAAVAGSSDADVAVTADGGTQGRDAGAAPPSKGSAGCAKPQTPGSALRNVSVGGSTRSYEVSVPSAGSTPQPVYVVFHGAGGNHSAVDGLGFNELGIGVYPDGVAQGGNGIGWDEGASGNDVAMFDAMIAAISADLCVDSARIYTVGFSWGGWMSSALGCLRGDVVAGFASVEGGFLNDTKSCRGPVPAWINHDKRDPAEPFSSSEHLRDAFLTVNGAQGPSAFDAPNPCVRYSGNAPVVFCTPDDGAHTWQSYATKSIASFFAAQ